jgi:hypothetical protein
MAFILSAARRQKRRPPRRRPKRTGQSSDVRGRHGGFPPGESIPLPVFVADLLGDHYQQQEQQSRPHRVASGAPAAAQAERNAARLVAFAQKGWCKSNRRIRVPSVITNKMIMVVIEEVAKTFKVSVSAIYESNIHNLLKNRQVVVRN